MDARKVQEVKQPLLGVVALSVRLRASLLNSPMLPINCPISSGATSPLPHQFLSFHSPHWAYPRDIFLLQAKDDFSITETLLRKNIFIKIIFTKM